MGGRFVGNWGRAKDRALLAILLLRRGGPVTTEELIRWLWDDPPAAVRKTLHSTVTRVRKAVAALVPSLQLSHDNGRYRLEIDETCVDYWQFRSLVGDAERAARHGEYEDARVLLRRALEMWDVPLADLRTRWADFQRQRLTAEVLLPTQYALLDSHHRLGDHRAVLELLDEIQADHLLDQKLAAHRIRALHGFGRYDEANQYYRDFRRRFVAETGRNPCAELQALQQKSIEGDDSPAPTSTARNTPAAEAPGPRDGVELCPMGDLPHDLWNFVGRENLLAELDECLDRWIANRGGGVIALDGFPGIGKTSLVIHWAHRVRDRFPDGQLYLDLRGFASESRIEPADAVVHLLVALGAAVELVPAGEARRKKLRSLLAGRRVLLILDNAANAAHVRPLLPLLTNCLILVTSRNQLTGLAVWHGAQRMTVLPLSDDQSTEWLGNHLGTRARGEPRALHTLASMCGGLPLAMQIVGQHVSSHHERRLADLVAELRDQRSMLSIGDGHENAILRTVFSWSYTTLTDDSKRLFRLLGIHPGPEFGVEVAAALLGSSTPDTRVQLDELVGAHLVHQTAIDRYRMHDLLWEYARGRVLDENTESRSDATARMLDWYLHTSNNADEAIAPLIERVPVPPPRAEVRPGRFDDDRSAMRWFRREKTNLIDVTHLAARLGFHRHAAPLPSTFIDAFRRMGFCEDLVPVFDIAVRAAKVLQDKDREASSFNNLGSTLESLREFDRAGQCFQTAYDLYAELGDRAGCSAALHNLGTHRVRTRQYDEGIEFYRRSWSLSTGIGLPGEEVRASRRLAWAYVQAGRHLDAMPQYEHALGLSRTIDDLRMQGTILAELGELHYTTGDSGAAARCCREALTLYRKSFHPSGAGLAHTVLALVAADRKEWREARLDARKAVEFWQRARDDEGTARALDVLGRALLALGQPEAAIEEWSRALSLFRALDHPRAETLRTELDRLMESIPRLRSTWTA
ncbi:ATP-binding protein [Streptoalloteichus hindustanus]|nr:tetratricopeptide repeat protein [Streptoalloteichus hindustanus]